MYFEFEIMTDIKPTVFTIGHSTHPLPAFVDLLRRHGVTALADVRSAPYSRFDPQYNREALEQALDGNGIKYVFWGRELGAETMEKTRSSLKIRLRVSY